MKKWIIWSYGRGSFQYDVLCGLILIAIFAIPRAVFNDRPDFMRLPPAGEVQRSIDDEGNVVYTVGIEGLIFGSVSEESEAEARVRLQAFLGSQEIPRIWKVEPVHNTRDTLAAYAFWVEP
jgi:hypothetical protein